MRDLSLRILAACLVITSACASAPTPKAATKGSEQGRALVALLSDPDKRDTAYCDLLRLGLFHRRAAAYRDDCLPVTQVISVPQASGPSLYLVFARPGYEVERSPNRRNASGPFSLFDSDGFIIPVFQGASLIDQDSELFSYSPQGAMAIGHAFGQSNGSAFEPGHWSVQVLHVVPTTADQKPVLSILLGPPVFGFEDACQGFFWSWRVREVEGDGWPEIEVGPRLDDQDNIAPAATYRWSPEKGNYVGPAGRPEDGFLSYSIDDDRNVDKRFADYWRHHRDNRNGHRRSQCRTGAGHARQNSSSPRIARYASTSAIGVR